MELNKEKEKFLPFSSLNFVLSESEKLLDLSYEGRFETLAS